MLHQQPGVRGQLAKLCRSNVQKVEGLSQEQGCTSAPIGAREVKLPAHFKKL